MVTLTATMTMHPTFIARTNKCAFKQNLKNDGKNWADSTSIIIVDKSEIKKMHVSKISLSSVQIEYKKTGLKEFHKHAMAFVATV